MFWKNTLLLSLSLTVFSCGPGQTTVSNNTAKDEKGSPTTKPNIPTKEKDVSIADMGKSIADVSKDVSTPIDMSKADMDVPNEAMYTPCGPKHDSEKFADMCIGIDQVLVDKLPKLAWINASHGCKLDMMFSASTRNLAGAIQYCSDLNFAGSQDWRLPTQDELSNLIIQSIADNVHLNYANKTCKIVIATDGYVLTEHVVSVGRQPGEKSPVASRFGVRCVRDL